MKFNIIHIILLIFIPTFVGSAVAQKASQSIPQLLTACTSFDASTISRAVRKLQRFEYNEFTTADKTKLNTILTKDTPHLSKLIKLAGFLQMTDELEALRQMEITNRRDKQALNLARTRCGNGNRLASMMKNVRKIPVNDRFVYEVAPMLVYVRQKAATNYLLELILEEEERCSPADAETPGSINCAYRLIEMVAPTIKDFPVKVGRTGDIITDDYQKALEEVRTWIHNNKNNYQLNTAIY